MEDRMEEKDRYFKDVLKTLEMPFRDVFTG